MALLLFVASFIARRAHDQRGQATSEYALILLGAAAVALLVVTWATKSDLIGQLLDGVLKHILDSIK
jgi:Flp pilus assembly pilin Flp